MKGGEIGNRRLPPSRKHEEDDFMKKLIAIAVVFALVAGTAFAVDLSADVTGHVNLFSGKSTGGGVSASGAMDAMKIEGSGEVAEGKFGAKIRTEFKWDNLKDVQGQGFAWWKPIDQFKLIIGQSNASDGFWGKDGNSGWMFNQKAYGTSIATGAANIWGGDQYSSVVYRGPFASSVDSTDVGLYMEIKPMDMLGINIGFTSLSKWDKDQFTKKFAFQVDLNLAFGNIALTYKGDNIYLYYGGSFGAINLDVGLSVPNLTAPGFSRLFFGAALKFSAGAFGVKVRTAEGIPVKSGVPFSVQFGVLPYFAINDNMCVFVNAEMGMDINHGLAKLGWTFNPYIRIGAEWGPSFYAGVQVEQKVKGGAIEFALPIGITVGF